MPPHMYDDLTGRDSQCIRLIYLDGIDTDHAHPNGLIRCRLETVALQDAPEYWALSYCWGDPNNPALIACNGSEVPVTRNLHAALLRLLKLEPRPPLWIDALSINQLDPHEKADQVNMMGQIYRRTQKVVVWLGPAGGDADDDDVDEDQAGQDVECAMDLCRKYSTVDVAPVDIRKRLLLSNFMQPAPGGGGKKIEIDLHRRSVYEHELGAIANLLGRSWWQRIWVIQELALARDVRVVCGDAMIEWDVFSSGICNFIDLCDPYGLDFSPIQFHHARTMLDFRTKPTDDGKRSEQGETRHRLVTLLQRFRWSYATDPRDKVYALLGLASAGPGQPTITVRYTSDPSGLHDVAGCYASATYDIIKANRSLDILQLCGVPPELLVEDSGREELPSWAPDFSLDTSKLANKFIDPGLLESPTLKVRLGLAEEPAPQPPSSPAHAFRAAGDSQADQVERLDPRSLQIGGFLWDSVEVVGIPSPDSAALMRSANEDEARIEEQQSGQSRAWLAHVKGLVVLAGSQIYDLLAWWELARALPQTYPNGQPLVDAFGAVVHQGHLETATGLPAERYAAHFKKVLRTLHGYDRYLLSLVPTRWRAARMAAMALFTLPLLAVWPSMDLKSAAHSRLVRTARGYLALVPQHTREGDRIALLRGGTVPFIVRPRGPVAGDGVAETKDPALRWQLVGSCYVHGIMHGEQWDESRCQPMVFV